MSLLVPKLRGALRVHFEVCVSVKTASRRRSLRDACAKQPQVSDPGAATNWTVIGSGTSSRQLAGLPLGAWPDVEQWAKATGGR